MNDATSPPVNRLPPLGADRPVWRDGLSVAPGLAQDGALAMDTSDDEEGARESSVAAAGSAFLGLGAKKRQSSRALRAPQASVDFAANAAAAAAVGKKRQSSGALRAPAPQGAQASCWKPRHATPRVARGRAQAGLLHDEEFIDEGGLERRFDEHAL